MPKIRQYADRDAMRALRGEIEAQGYRYGYRSQKALAEVLGVSQSTVGNWLRDPEGVSLRGLRVLVRSLRLDPDIVLKALGYTAQEIRNWKKIGEE